MGINDGKLKGENEHMFKVCHWDVDCQIWVPDKRSVVALLWYQIALLLKHNTAATSKVYFPWISTNANT